MKRYLLNILAAIVYFVGIPICCADDLSPNYFLPDASHMQVVNQALDKIEAASNSRKILSSPVITPKKNEIEFSSESYWAKYDEPKNYSQKGFLSGYNVQYAHRISTNPNSMINMFKLQAQWANGKFKQDPNVGPSGIKDNTYDLRGVIGQDFYPASYVRTTGYFGYGYRYLKDNSDSLVAVLDNGTVTVPGYNRYSHYNYLPLGVDIAFQTDSIFSIESNLEYDYMFYGYQVSELGVYPGYNTLVVHQTNGSGLRASLRFNLYLKYCTAFAEGFFRVWDIPQSNTKTDPTGLTDGLNEPRNNTEEFGFRLGLEV